MQHNKTDASASSAIAVNRQFHYNRYFSMIPTGPERRSSRSRRGFFELADGAESEAARRWRSSAPTPSSASNATDGARENAKAAGFEIVYDQNYPPPTTDFAPIMRAVQATNPDIVFVAAYPPDTVGIVRAANEVGLHAKMFGGAMIGLLATPIKMQLGPLMNGIVNQCRASCRRPTFDFPGTQGVAGEVSGQGARPRASIRSATPSRRSAMRPARCWRRRSRATKSLDQASSPTTCTATASRPSSARSRSARTANGRSRVSSSPSSRTSPANDVDQFRDGSHEPILWPPEIKTGAIIYPFSAARK